MRTLGLTAALVGAGAGGIWLTQQNADQGQPDLAAYTIPRHVSYSFVVENPTNRPLRNVRFWTYAPVKRTAEQWVERIDTNAGSTVEPDALGNQRLWVEIPLLPPFGKQNVDIRVDMLLADGRNADAVSDVSAQDLAAQRFVPVDDARIRARADAFRNQPQPLKAAYDWVASHLAESGYLAADHGALYALETGKGDCSEHMYLLASTLRAMGHPTRLLSGAVASHDSRLSASQLHNWVAVQRGDGWQGIDSEAGEFDTTGKGYIAFRVIDPRSAFYGDGSQAFFGIEGQARVSMR